MVNDQKGTGRFYIVVIGDEGAAFQKKGKLCTLDTSKYEEGDSVNHEKLSVRLSKVAQQVPKNSRLADIGSDHAYLPCHLVLSGRISFAIAGEVVEGPFLSAQQQVATLGLQQHIHVRLADGLDAITPQDAIDVVTICGMGGDLIAQILERGFKKGLLHTVKKLVLQPNVGEYQLRKWLVQHQFLITKEVLVIENRKFYEIIVAVPYASIPVYTDYQLRYGFFLPQEGAPAFVAKYEREVQKYQRILQQLQHAKKYEGQKITTITNRIKELKELIERHDANR